MKITAKTTKQELKDFLGANCKDVKKQDKALFERLAYADAMLKKDEKKVTRQDLATLAKEVIKVLGDKVVTPAVAEETPVEVKAENSVKKTTKKKETPVEETPKAEKTAKKSLGKKKETPKDVVTELEPVTDSKKAVQLAKTFPQSFEVEGTKYEIANDIKTIEDAYNAIADDEGLIAAFYWTQRHLKQFPYFGGLLGQPKSFDNNLDLCSCIMISDQHKVAYFASMYTEAFYTLLPEHFVEEDGIRLSGGIEFQLYRIVEDEEEDEE